MNLELSNSGILDSTPIGVGGYVGKAKAPIVRGTIKPSQNTSGRFYKRPVNTTGTKIAQNIPYGIKVKPSKPATSNVSGAEAVQEEEVIVVPTNAGGGVKPVVTTRSIAEQIKAVQGEDSAPRPMSASTSGSGINLAPVIKSDNASSPAKDTTKTESKTDTDTNAKTKSEKNIWNQYWFLGIAVGALGGLIYAKSKNKSVLSAILFGGAVGGGLGFATDKYLSKGATGAKVAGDASTGSSTSISTGVSSLEDKTYGVVKKLMLQMATMFSNGDKNAIKDLQDSFKAEEPKMRAKLKEKLAALKDDEKKAFAEILDETDKGLKDLNLNNMFDAKKQEELNKKNDELMSKIKAKYPSVDVDKLMGILAGK